jgi:hypothetical protein
MAEPERSPRPVYEDLGFQKTSRVLQRAGQIACGLVALLALAGIFSHGPLSPAVARQEESGLTVWYERFQRVTAQHAFDVALPPDIGDPRLMLSRSFQDTYNIDSIEPQPVRATPVVNGAAFTFNAPDTGNLDVRVRVRPRKFGIVPIEIGNAAGSVRFSVIIYP